MAGASTYPDSLDNDTNLILVTGTDALIPAQHNNLKDAIQSTEMSLGVMDSTGDGREASTYAAPVAHRLGVGTLIGTNPRYPWGTPDANSWYGILQNPPAGWTVGGGITVDPLPDPQYLRVDVPATVDVVAISFSPAPTGAWAGIWRMALPLLEADAVVEVGFVETGEASITGMHLDSNIHCTPINGSGAIGPAVTLDGLGVLSQFIYYQVAWDGTNWAMAISVDARHWYTLASAIAGAAPIELRVHVIAGAAAAQRLWFDYIGQGPAVVGSL